MKRASWLLSFGDLLTLLLCFFVLGGVAQYDANARINSDNPGNSITPWGGTELADKGPKTRALTRAELDDYRINAQSLVAQVCGDDWADALAVASALSTRAREDGFHSAIRVMSGSCGDDWPAGYVAKVQDNG